MNKRLKIIIAAGMILLVALAIGATFLANQFQVIKTVPTHGGTHNIENSISFEWNKPIQKNITIKTEPNFDYSATVKDNKLTIKPKTNLVANTLYTVTVSNVKQVNSKKVESRVVLVFTAAIIPYDELPLEQQQEIVGEVDEQYEKYPLLAILPTQHPDFSIEERYVGDKMYIVITPAVLATGLSEEEYNKTYKSYYDEAMAYLTLKEHSLKAYNIISDQEFMRLEQEAAKPAQ